MRKHRNDISSKTNRISIFLRSAEVQRVKEEGTHKNTEPAFLAGDLLWFGGISLNENGDEDYKAAALKNAEIETMALALVFLLFAVSENILCPVLRPSCLFLCSPCHLHHRDSPLFAPF